MKTLQFLLLACLFFYACNSANKAEKAAAEITTLEQELATEPQPSMEKLAQLVKLYEGYVNDFPSEAPTNVNYLMKAAEAARTLGDFQKALAFYDRIINDFPGNEKSPHALFMKGYTFDNDLQNQDSARALLQQFVQLYPNDDFADDAQFLLDNLGKSNEEIIREFEAKQNASQ